MGGVSGNRHKAEPEHATLKYATNHSDYQDASFALIASDSHRLADNLWSQINRLRDGQGAFSLRRGSFGDRPCSALMVSAQPIPLMKE